MKYIVSFFIVFFSIYFSSAIQAQGTDAKQIARDLYLELHAGDYEKAYHTANLLRRKVSTNLILGSCLYGEYARLCLEESLPCGDEELRQFLDMYKYSYISTPIKYIRQLDELSRYFYNKQDSKSAIIVFETLLESDDILSPEEHVKYLCGKGWAYNYCKEPYKAYKSFALSVDYAKERFGIFSEQYAKSLNGLAYECQYLHKNNLPYYLQLADIYKTLYGENAYVVAINYDNIGGRLIKECHNPDSALFYHQKAISILKEMECPPKDIMKCLSNMGVCYSYLGNEQKALECYKSALLYDCGSTLLYNIAHIYKKQGEIDTAFEYINQMDSIWRTDHYGSFVAECYAAKGDLKNFIHYYTCELNFFKDVWRNNFLQMIGSERQSFLYDGYNCDFDPLFVIAEQYKNNEAAKICFDYLLAIKSLSLSFDQHIKDIVHASNNLDLKAEFNEMIRLRNLAKYDNSVLRIAQNSEELFLQHLQELTDYTELLDITSTDVSRSLQKQDVVIEFYNADEHDENNLYALVLTSDNIVNIYKVGPSDSIDETIIWKTLLNAIKPYKNIYFSADGIVNLLPMESASIDGEYLSDHYNIFRLSSSRQLALRRLCRDNTNQYVLYGGLDYSCESTASTKTLRNNSDAETNNTLLEKLRGADLEIQELPGTLIEVNDIAKTIKRYNKLADTKTLIGQKGTESSLKQLSGKKVNLLHLATHGFYYGDKTKAVVNNVNYDEERIIGMEDIILTNSGLYMSGAEYSLNNSCDEYNDGILTSFEVSTLDLRGLNLVTLSACETGLGNITSDGVFGLQRGFKKAGANSILLSLWKVDDEATCKLMTEFYSNWIGKKMTKHGALEAAKKTVRETPGWEDPKYWASFILLDGLD